MNDKTICGIYCIENLINHKKYIGQSVDIYRRWKRHKKELRKNIHNNAHLQNAWNKYGEENFIFYIIEECEFLELDQKEMYYILKFDTFCDGYNQTLGGEGSVGYKHNDSIKKKMSEIKLQQFCDLKNREKLRDAHKFESKPIYQIDFCGNIVQEWESANWAAKVLGYSQTRIYEALNHLNRKKTYGGYIWIYVEEYDQDSFDVNWYIDRQWKYKSFYQYDLNLNFIKKFDSILEAEKDGFNRESIYKCCNFKQKTHKGFIFRDYLISSKEEEVDNCGNCQECREKGCA